MSSRLAHHSGIRPAVGLPYEVPHGLTLAEVEEAVRGKSGGTNPNAPAILDRIGGIISAMDCLDKRRDSAGALSEADSRDYDTITAPLAGLLRQLGLYPQGS